MGTAYRDVARIVSKSTGNRFREGFFDELLEMDQMPVTGMVMTYALDRVVPDSANAATAWAAGNKTIEGALNAFPDNNDSKFNGSNLQATKQFALDNPRVETLYVHSPATITPIEVNISERNSKYAPFIFRLSCEPLRRIRMPAMLTIRPNAATISIVPLCISGGLRKRSYGRTVIICVTLQIIWRSSLQAIWRKPASADAGQWQGEL
jgi:Alkaline phosphatase